MTEREPWSARDQFKRNARYILEAQQAAGPEVSSEPFTPPEFPLDIFPAAARRYVEETAASVPIPPEMVAVPMIAMTGGLIGNRAHIQLKRGWSEYAGLYMMVVAGPGTNKSAAIKHARWPLRALQRESQRIYKAAYEEHKQKRQIWKTDKPEARGEEPRPPRMRHYFTTDVTLERLAGMLEVAPGVCISSDEMSGWVKRMNQYRQGGDREQYLSIWAAEPIKVDRQSREVYVEIPVVSVFGGIQPEVVPTLHADSQIRDGFVERLLPFLPVLPPKKWKRRVEVSPEAYRGVAELFRGIDQLPLLGEADDEEGGEPPGMAISLSTQADHWWGRWYDENNALARELGGFVGGFYIKLEAHVARFALILHIMAHAHDDPRVMIDAETMKAAIDLGEYFRAQIGGFLPLLLQGAPASSKGAGLLGRIERAISRKGRTIKLSDQGNEEFQCLGSSELLRTLGVKKEEVMNELDTLIERERYVIQATIPTGANPMQAFCMKSENGLTVGRQFDSYDSSTVSIPTPGMVVNGRVVEDR